MRTSLRTRLVWLRLLLLYVLLCAVAFVAALTLRDRADQGVGLNTPLPAPADLPYLGVTAELDTLNAQTRAADLARLADMGVGWVRIRLDWDTLEPTPGAFDWASTDAVIAAITDAGLVPVVVLANSPAWARDERDRATANGRHAPPTDVTDYARFVAAVATRYGASVRHYQLWDEPNIAPNWGARHVEAAGYTQLLKAGATAIRQADADAVILLAALAPTADRGHTAQDEVYFLQRLYAAGAAPFFDVAAAQPFGFGNTPDAPRVDRTVLDFRRVLLMRRAMLAAGDGTTPIWIVRYGWNRRLASPWATVSPDDQIAFAVAALDLAYRQWPWVAAQGWVIDQPQAPPDDPVWGFALTPALADAFRQWSQTTGQTPRIATAPAASWGALGELALVGLALLWRAWAALRLLPGAVIRAPRRPSWQTVVGWTALIVVYYLATWPPLIVACWLVAAWLLRDRPRWGIALALVLLPLHDFHKDIDLLFAQLAVPPEQAVLLCLLPALIRHPPRRRWDAWDGLALGWLLVALPGMLTVWHWSAYVQGMADLVVAPLLLYTLVRADASTSGNGWWTAATALWLGGVLAAAWGLTGWIWSGGNFAREIWRIAGPTATPNHLALYLARTLFLGLGLLLAARGKMRIGLAVGSILVAGALILTSSRGALLLALPAGVMLAAWLRWRRPLRLVWLGGAALGLGSLAALFRLQDTASVTARVVGWTATLPLAMDTLLTGLGPDGFYWRFPAYLPLNSTFDPNLRHPHTLLLELLVMGGLPALAWFVAACYMVFRRLRRAGEPFGPLTWPVLGILAALVAAIAHAQMDAFFSLPAIAAWNWVTLALLAAAWSPKPKAAAPTHEGSGSH